MADACLTLLRDPVIRRRLGAAARVRVLELFTVGTAIAEFREIYGALGRGKRPLAAAAEPHADNQSGTDNFTADESAAVRAKVR
jgi:hypothetical protein